MKYISLNRDYHAMVDDEDFDELSKYKWFISKTPNTIYAKRSIKKDTFWSTQRMHNFLIPEAKRIDHINGNGLDNQRENLRPATPGENSRNLPNWRKLNKSGYLGVSWSNSRKKWVASIAKTEGGRIKHWFLGHFNDPIEAARVRDLSAIELHGEFATLNFPELLDNSTTIE